MTCSVSARCDGNSKSALNRRSVEISSIRLIIYSFASVTKRVDLNESCAIQVTETLNSTS